MPCRLLPALLSLLSFAFTSNLAADWPQFRGPTGQGHATSGDLPIEWSQTKNVTWRQPIAGSGWSSPILYRGRIFLTSAIPVETAGRNGFSLSAICLDAKTGKSLWTREVFYQDSKTAPRIHKKNGHASPTPLADGEQLFVHFGHQGIACLDLEGNILWRNDRIKYPPVHGNGGSPALVDDRLIFSCDGGSNPFIVAVHRDTGKLLWRTDRVVEVKKKFSFCTPLVIEVGGKKQAIIPGSNVVCSYDVKSGKEIWRVRYDGYSVIPRPVYANNMIFISTSYDTPSVLAIRPDGRGDVTDSHLVWKLKKGAPHTPSMLAIGAELYMISDRGIATCVDAKTGKQHWQKRIGGNFSSSPLFAGGKIYFQNEKGDGVVIKASKNFEKLAENSLGERTLASYAVGDGVFFIRTAKHLYRIEKR